MTAEYAILVTGHPPGDGDPLGPAPQLELHVATVLKESTPQGWRFAIRDAHQGAVHAAAPATSPIP